MICVFFYVEHKRYPALLRTIKEFNSSLVLIFIQVEVVITDWFKSIYHALVQVELGIFPFTLLCTIGLEE